MQKDFFQIGVLVLETIAVKHTFFYHKLGSNLPLYLIICDDEISARDFKTYYFMFKMF